MPSVNVHVHVMVDTGKGQRPITFGDRSKPVVLTIAGEGNKYEFSVGTETTVTVWTAGSSEISDFDFLLVAADRDVILELTTDNAADVGEEVYTIEVAGSGTANEYGLPVMLGSDDSYANYTKNFAGGTLDVIDRIRVRNLDTTNAANVIVILAT